MSSELILLQHFCRLFIVLLYRFESEVVMLQRLAKAWKCGNNKWNILWVKWLLSFYRFHSTKGKTLSLMSYQTELSWWLNMTLWFFRSGWDKTIRLTISQFLCNAVTCVQRVSYVLIQLRVVRILEIWNAALWHNIKISKLPFCITNVLIKLIVKVLFQ